VPALRGEEIGNDADRRMSVLLYVHPLRDDAAAQVGRLLRILFVRLGSMSTNPGRAIGEAWRIAMLRWIRSRNDTDLYRKNS
jgi:hypothetical protein